MKDIYLKPIESGQDLLLINGLPTLTGGLDNMVYMLLITGDWWGNNEADIDGQLTSKIPEIMASGVLTNKTRLDIIDEALRVTQIMIDLGIADTIEVNAEIPRLGVLFLSVKINEPESIPGQDFIYALNWDNQKITIEEDTW